MWLTMRPMRRTARFAIPNPVARAVPHHPRSPNEMLPASIRGPRRRPNASQSQRLILTFTTTRFLATRTLSRPAATELGASPHRLATRPSPNRLRPPSHRPSPPRTTPREPASRQDTQSKTGTPPKRRSFCWGACLTPTLWANGSTTGPCSTMAQRHPWPMLRVTCGCC